MDEQWTRTLERLRAKDEITETLLRYARGADRLDPGLQQSAFWPEAVLDYGPMFHGSAVEFSAFLEAVHRPMATHTHHVSNISIQIDVDTGDTAVSEAYVLVRTRTRDESGLHDMQAHGRYVDRWERRDGEWRIAGRTYVHSLDEVVEVTGEVYGPAGSRDGSSDPSYALER
jgi:hypothetical protein